VIEARKGLGQGSVLSPILFNIYLEEAITSSKLMNMLVKEGRLLAYADDLVIRA
jgi:retron-type reverse transcriptase